VLNAFPEESEDAMCAYAENRMRKSLAKSWAKVKSKN
jgi:hypothetical protein